MKQMLNGIFSFLKWILFIISFGITFYIILSMYNRLNKSMIESIDIFIPFIILLILYFINLIFNQSNITKNVFYNLTSVLVFLTITLVGVRSICDKNMILNKVMGYGINFFYFSNFVSFMKILLYGLSISNIFFMIQKSKKVENNPIKPIAKKISNEYIEPSSIEVL